MMRSIAALFLSLVIASAGLTLARARGASHDIGQDMVICSGVGMVIVAIGPDGAPVKKAEPCPDGVSVFATSFAVPAVLRPEPRVLAPYVAALPSEPGARNELSPSARGPPVRV